jgi:hypothetical protein
MLTHFLGRSTQKFSHGIVTDMQLPRLPHVYDASQGDNTLQSWLVSGEAKGEFSAGGVAHYEKPGGIKFVFRGDLREEAVACSNVLESSGPSAALISDTAILEIPRCDASCNEGVANGIGQSQIVLSSPKTAVNVHHKGKGT